MRAPRSAAFLHTAAQMPSETLFDYVSLTFGRDGSAYLPRACVADTADGRCRIWIEFVPVGRGPVLRSALETIKADRRDAAAWAVSLSTSRLETGVNEARHWAAAREAHS
jgi:hypothetical protein